MAVLTDANPSHDYGTATLRGVAARIFAAGARRRAGRRRTRRPCDAPAFADVLARAPGIRVELAYGGPRQPHRPPAARLLPAVGVSAAPGRARPGAGPARPAPARPRPAVLDAYRPARASRALVRWAREERAPGARGHLHRPPQPPQHRQRRGPDAGPAPRRAAAADGHGLRRPRPARAHPRRGGAARCATGSMLKRAMERHGFSGYWREWWHFEHRVQAAPSSRPHARLSAPRTRDNRWDERAAPRGARPDRTPRSATSRQRAQDRRATSARARERRGRAGRVPRARAHGYPPEDLLLKTSFLDAAAAALDELAAQTRGIVALVGFPERARRRLQRRRGARRRRRGGRLPQDATCPTTASSTSSATSRPASEAVIFELNGVPIGLSVCEDIWEPGPPAMTRGAGRRAGAREPLGLAVPARLRDPARADARPARRGLPGRRGVREHRRRPGRARLRRPQRGRETRAATVLARCPQFEESLAVCTIDPREVVAARLRDTRHRANVRRQRRTGRSPSSPSRSGPSLAMPAARRVDRVGGEVAPAARLRGGRGVRGAAHRAARLRREERLRARRARRCPAASTPRSSR